MMHKPIHTVFFATVVFSVLGLLSFIFPKSGIRINNDVTFYFPELSSLLESNLKNNQVSKILAAADSLDTLTNNNEMNVSLKDSLPKLNTGIQMKNKDALKFFFESLKSVKGSDKSIRVLHYGDSQIEGDRITDYLRLKLQGQFGGQGPGLISLMPIAPSVTNKVTNSAGWDRYNIFTFKDNRVNHSNYGVMAGFSRFYGYRKISDTTKLLNAELQVETSKLGGSNALLYKKLKLFYGGAQTKTWCEFYDGPALITADSLESGGYMKIKNYEVGRESNNHKFKFVGRDSPDFYAISLESDNGVMVDNIPLRGSSGTFFHQINAAQLKSFYDYLNVKLIILQFGGNVLPSVKDATMAANYGDYFRYQLSIVKKLAPNASILFIGPADMSVKQGTSYVTTPFLEETRDAIKKAVLDNGAAYFDMYDCMGGRNSMPIWVEQKMAASDYIHFSPQGARKIATLFYTALIKEYNTYINQKTN
jgi:lysophospholipase L1-like esterase